MTGNSNKLLLDLLNNPEQFPDLGVGEQDLLLRLLRRSGLLPWLFFRLQAGNLLDRVLPKIQDHLEGAKAVAAADERMLRWEVNRIRRALFGTGIPVILLKGAAYIHAALPMAKGRLVADVDLLFAKGDLDIVQQCLGRHGWREVKMNAYDQGYYRDWMHELPPMQHWERLTELDLHHTILPVVGRLKPDSQLLLDSIVPVAGEEGVWTLSPVDMVLHAMVHLFYDADFDRGLRDMVDLDGMFRHFGESDAEFWSTLLPRARELGIARPLFYALHHLHTMMQTPIPAAVLADSRGDAAAWPVRTLMNFLIPRALVPGHPESANVARILAWWPLYVRSHWLKMPPGLLFSHLLRKLSRKWKPTMRNRRQV
jgi:hypothetical protein